MYDTVCFGRSIASAQIRRIVLKYMQTGELAAPVQVHTKKNPYKTRVIPV